MRIIQIAIGIGCGYVMYKLLTTIVLIVHAASNVLLIMYQ